MTAMEYLSQVQKIEKLINAKQTELCRLRLDAASVSSPAFSDKVQSGRTNNTMSTVDKIIDLNNFINEEIDKLIDAKAEIHKKIQCVYNPDFIALLTDKYINGYTLEQIAERMNKSYETVKGWHGEALQIFRKETGMI